jgi:hypothetical protein
MNRLRTLLVALALALCAAPLAAQTTTIRATDSSTGAAIESVGDATNSAIRFSCIIGCYPDTQPISATALPLPTSAATSTIQADGSQKTQIVDGSGNVIASTSNNLNVQCANCSGSGASAADNASVTESTSTFAPAGGEFLTTPGTVTTGHQSMVAITAHRAFHVSFFDASGNAMLGSKVSASSLPVVIASDQGAVAVSGTFWQTTQPVSLASVPSHAVTNAGTFAVQAAQSGTWTVQPGNTANTTAWLVAGGKTNNNAAPGATNFGVLPALANASTPSWTEGDQVALSADLSGRVRGLADINNGSDTVTDAATQTQGASSVATVESYQFKSSGSTYARVVGDPCELNAKVYLPFSQATSAQLIPGTSSKKTYLCSVTLVAGDAENVSFVSGTGTVCATSIAAVIGSTTAANGLNLAANGGFAMGNGASALAAITANAANLCLLQSGTGRVSGVLTYVVQ